MQIKRILIIAPHTDDAELGCGGTIARFLEDKIDIHIAAFSTAEESLPADMGPDTLKNEFFEAMRILGFSPDRSRVYDYPVRKLSYHRQEVLEELVRLRQEISPDMVLVPSGRDLHQDHQVVHAEGLRAFRDITLWGYELPWNQITFSTQAFVRLERRHIQKKCEALQAYKSQLRLLRPYFSIEFIEGLARLRGVQVKSEFAEAFEVMRITW